MTTAAWITIAVLALCAAGLIGIVSEAAAGLRESKRWLREREERAARTVAYNAKRAAERTAHEAEIARARAIIKG
ncbi:hypothetical protein [Zavarzinia sp.]|jgi:hypothetical protein|uniref:hypothetical protein n=1 Tax=Zavarzinia sp. TaxID=2027920 RepID=UPI003568DD24